MHQEGQILAEPCIRADPNRAFTPLLTCAISLHVVPTTSPKRGSKLSFRASDFCFLHQATKCNINYNINRATLKWGWSYHARGSVLKRPMSQTFGMFEHGKMTFRLGLSNLVSQKIACQDNKKAVILTTGLMTTRSKM